MKAILLAAALLATVPALAQTAPPAGRGAAQIFKGTNALLIETPEVGAESISKLAETMKMQGYAIDSLTDYKVVTKPREYEFNRNGVIAPALHRFRAVLSGAPKVLLLTGTIRTQLNVIQKFEASMGWYGEKEVFQEKACLIQAYKLASAYPGAKVLYTKIILSQ